MRRHWSNDQEKATNESPPRPRFLTPSHSRFRQAAAIRLAKQEQEHQAREDEVLALRLAVREEEDVERRAHARRLHRNARRNSASTLVLDPATAAAVATGEEVSEAVRVLQFQDIDENDFETLLALDDAGGAEGRCCAGGRGLTERAVEEVLENARAGGQRLTESCAICISDFELDDEVRTSSVWLGGPPLIHPPPSPFTARVLVLFFGLFPSFFLCFSCFTRVVSRAAEAQGPVPCQSRLRQESSGGAHSNGEEAGHVCLRKGRQPGSVGNHVPICAYALCVRAAYTQNGYYILVFF